MAGTPITIAQAAEKLGVTRQRMHQLCETYGLHKQYPSKKLIMIDPDELGKIPAKRPTGVHQESK